MLRKQEKGIQAAAPEKSDDYTCGMNDVWNAVQKICAYPSEGGLWESDLYRIFGTGDPRKIISRITPQDAVLMIREDEKERNGIHAGDWVTTCRGQEKTAKVTKVDGGYAWLIFGDGECGKADINDCRKSETPDAGVTALLKMMEKN